MMRRIIDILKMTKMQHYKNNVDFNCAKRWSCCPGLLVYLRSEIKNKVEIYATKSTERTVI